MDKQLLSYLCCPACKNELIGADLKENDQSQIMGGYFFCNKCQINYEVIEGIPVLLSLKSEGE